MTTFRKSSILSLLLTLPLLAFTGCAGIQPALKTEPAWKPDHVQTFRLESNVPKYIWWAQPKADKAIVDSLGRSLIAKGTWPKNEALDLRLVIDQLETRCASLSGCQVLSVHLSGFQGSEKVLDAIFQQPPRQLFDVLKFWEAPRSPKRIGDLLADEIDAARK